MKIKILLSEDNYIAQRVTALTLEACNCDVDIAIDGKETLSLLEKNTYDLLFVDYGLPDMKGPELTKKIRAIKGLEKLPVVALSAHQPGDIEGKNFELECLRADMNAYFTKPLYEDMIKDIFEAFIPHKINQ
jgi:two-component system aerobic respiration control sensor histidine kinase ArcB